MNLTYRHAMTASALVMAAMVLSACNSSRFDDTQIYTTPAQQLQPVQSSSVQTQTLPPLNGQSTTTGSTTDVYGNTSTTGTASAGTYGTYSTSEGFETSGDPALSGDQTASTDGSFVSLDDVGAMPTGSGRDLSGALNVNKLLGVWTVSAGSNSCRLNLTQTAKTGTNRYRASTPNCAIPALALVSSWQLAGNSVQLFDESGAIVGSLLLSGNSFIGTLSGGIAVTMVG